MAKTDRIELREYEGGGGGGGTPRRGKGRRGRAERPSGGIGPVVTPRPQRRRSPGPSPETGKVTPSASPPFAGKTRGKRREAHKRGLWDCEISTRRIWVYGPKLGHLDFRVRRAQVLTCPWPLSVLLIFLYCLFYDYTKIYNIHKVFGKLTLYHQMK
jgi:hypothetical protein